jgi:preprotein translocase subunit SecB
MKPSPIQLLDYFFTDLHVSANQTFDPKQEVPLSFEDFEVALEATKSPENKREWRVILNLKSQPAAEANVPYRFTVQIVGEFLVLDVYPEDHIERLVKTNGASMLFGILREVIRDTTTRGPYSGVILPSASFYEPQDKSEAAPKSAKELAKPADPIAPRTK